MLDMVFSQHDLAWLDDILPEKEKKKKDDEKKNKKDKKKAKGGDDSEDDVSGFKHMHWMSDVVDWCFAQRKACSAGVSKKMFYLGLLKNRPDWNPKTDWDSDLWLYVPLVPPFGRKEHNECKRPPRFFTNFYLLTGQVSPLYKLLARWFGHGSQVLCAQTTRSIPWPLTGARLQLRVGGTMPTRQLLLLINTWSSH